MIDAIDNGILTTDLDANNFNLLNVGIIVPDPTDTGWNLVFTTDPRLSDPRVPLDGSVTDAKVAGGAAIDQSKISFDGDIPTGWLGTTNVTAARGDLAEYKANKGQPNGYASLDNSGLVPSAQLPPGVGTGTVTSIALTAPGDFGISGSPVTTSGTIALTWNNVADGSWYGNSSGAPAAPSFHTSALPVSVIPNLDASIITSGTFDPARMPTAVGVGIGHAPGAVPDPGLGGSATDYLGRDMLYHSVPTIAPSYQPMVPDPLLLHTTAPGDMIVTITEVLVEASIFVNITPAVGYTELGLVPSFSTPLTLPAGQTMTVYAAKQGYKNSNIITLVN